MIEIINLEVFTKQTLLNFLRNLYTLPNFFTLMMSTNYPEEKAELKKIAPQY